MGGGRSGASRPGPAHPDFRRDKRRWVRGLAIVAVGLALAACASEPAAAAPDNEALVSYLNGLRQASCPAGTSATTAEAIELKATPVPLQPINPKRKAVGALTYLGGFHLTSPDKRFGGISDLKVLPDGNLLAETDEGNVVWIDLDKDGLAPTAARIAPLLDASGQPLNDKAEADAEGLAYRQGLAFISFERNHRVLAYDVDGCGAAARGAPIVLNGRGRALNEAFADAKINVTANSGVEALGVTPDGFLAIGLETQVKGQGPLSLRPIEAAPDFDLRIETGAPDLVSIDFLPAGETGRDLRAFTLHRGFDSLLGNAIVVTETLLTRDLDQTNLAARVISAADERSHERFDVASSRRLAEMSVLFTIDNFEGIAVRRMPTGEVRLYLVSDDNFSKSQRTLLMVFDLPE